MNRTYIFHAGSGESHWQSARRLAEEVGWTLEVDESTAARMRSNTGPRSASRALTTRRQFIEALIAEGKE
jgi:hypothetical protein